MVDEGRLEVYLQWIHKKGIHTRNRHDAHSTSQARCRWVTHHAKLTMGPLNGHGVMLGDPAANRLMTRMHFHLIIYR